jgi:hypothetical protein
VGAFGARPKADGQSAVYNLFKHRFVGIAGIGA